MPAVVSAADMLAETEASSFVGAQQHCARLTRHGSPLLHPNSLLLPLRSERTECQSLFAQRMLSQREPKSIRQIPVGVSLRAGASHEDGEAEGEEEKGRRKDS